MNIFSGMRPSGALHIGHYLGVIKQWLELQDQANQMIVGAVDYHATTTSFDPAALSQQTIETVRDYLAAGITAPIIVQSWIPEHAELALIFANTAPLSWFEKVPTFKEIANEQETVTLGLLSYPALMAADILIYNSTHVPVGEDQLPHIELVNKIVKRLNQHYGTTLQAIEAIVPEQGARIMSLQDPTKKMSKSGDEGVALGDSPDTIRKKIKSAVTDSRNDVRYDPKDKPGVSNLLEIGALLSRKSIDDVRNEYGNNGYAEFKEGIAELVVEALAPVRERREELDDNVILDTVRRGVEEVRPIAQETLREIKQQLGFISRK